LRWVALSLILLSACAPMTSPTMGAPVSGERFEREVAGQVMSFRLPRAQLAEAQFQPDGTAVYSGRALNGIGRWRPWKDGYCAYYPWLGASPALRPPFSGPVERDGYRCYAVRAESGYYVLFQPDGTYVGTLVPVSG
jgi:hypothetical protein